MQEKEKTELSPERQEYYKPSNHPYTIHITYTGPGCAHCGKPEAGHKIILDTKPKL